MARRHPKEVVDFIAANVAGRTTRELVELTNARFGTEFTESSMKSHKSNHGLRSGTPSGRPAGYYSSVFTRPVVDYILEHYKGCGTAEMARRLNTEFGMSYTASQIKSFYANHKLKCGLSARFEKGYVSFNKGRKGWYAPGTERTRFKKGNLPANTKPIGYERITKDGYIEVKVKMRPSNHLCNDNFVFKHRLVWEAANGPIPSGYVVIFRDGDKQNCELSNLCLIKRAGHRVMNKRGLRSSNPDITDAGVLVARVRTAIYSKKKDGRRDKAMKEGT